ncbi:MAG TPA: histidine kinase [Jiangellaceae bacterium]
MSQRNRVTDIALAAVVFGLSVGITANHGVGVPNPADRDLDARAVAILVVYALPLVWRRSYPLVAYATTSLATFTMIGLDYALDLPVAPLIALYQVAVTYTADPRRARRWIAAAAGAAFVPATALAYLVSDKTARVVPDMLVVAIVVVAVWIAGDRTRLRRERVAELEARTLRAERETERERRLAAAEERTRIARELHDSAGHALNVILVQAGAARLLHTRDPDRSRLAIVTIEDVARGTIGEIDRLVHALRDDQDLEPPADPAALDDLLDRHRLAGLSIATDLRGRRHDMPRSVSWATYRILQEALTNAARHGTGNAEVTVSFETDAVDITVTNPIPRHGLAAGSEPNRDTGGHGIVGMRERATLLGGTLMTAAEAGSFRLHARLPYGDVTS